MPEDGNRQCQHRGGGQHVMERLLLFWADAGDMEKQHRLLEMASLKSDAGSHAGASW